MNKSVRNIVAGGAVAGLLALSSVAVASAAQPVVAGGPAGAGQCASQAAAVKAGASVDNLRVFGDCEIARRITTLDTLSSRISGSKVMTSAHAATLSGFVSSDKSGLTALKATIDSETDLTALKADVRKIATDYRVYVLLVPQVHLTNGADAVAASQVVFTKLNTNLAARIAKAKAAGKDTAAAQADLDAMNAAASQAQSLASPLAGNLLALTPAQWNAGTAAPVIKDARAKLAQARNLLQSARKDAQACRDALR